MNEAQKIADAVLASVEGEDLLIEAMARAMCGIVNPEMDPDALCGERGPYWNFYQKEAKIRLVCDRVLRGPGNRAAYDRIVAQAKEREL